jgi:hypothetical protein
MVTTTTAVTSMMSKTVELQVKYSTTTKHNPHEANYCYGRGNDVNIRMVTTAVTSTACKQIVWVLIVWVLLDRGHNGHLGSLCYQRQTYAVSLLKKAGSTVVEYFEWDLPD